MQRKFLPLLLVIGLACAWASPRSGAMTVSSKPGWGRVFSPEEEKMTVRAVPAAATPSRPVTRLGRPGWGRF